MADEIRRTVRLPQNLDAKLQKLAEIERRSINSQMEVAVQRMIEQYEREHGQLK